MKVDLDELERDLERISMYGAADRVRDKLRRIIAELREYREKEKEKAGEGSGWFGWLGF